MLFLLLLVNPAYAQEETQEALTNAVTEKLPALEQSIATEEQLEEQIKEIEEQMEVQVENTMAICQALGITCEEEAAGKLVEALNELVAPEPEPVESASTDDEDTESDSASEPEISG